MNIIEAIKSGKKFKRRIHTRYYPKLGDAVSGMSYRFDAADMLAQDWEVEESSVTIYRSQFEAAWKRVVLFDAPQVKELLAKELGL